MRQRMGSSVLVALLLAATLLTGCGSSRATTSAMNSSAPPMEGVAQSAPIAPGSAPAKPATSGGGGGDTSTSKAASTSAATAEKGGNTGAAQAKSSTVDNRKLIYLADVSLKVTNIDEALQKLQNLTDYNQGYVSALRKNGTPEQGFNASISLRIPTEHFEEAMAKIHSDLGTLTDERRDVQDVTSQYVDLAARLKSAQEHEQHLLSLMHQSASLDELLKLENDLERVRGQIESMQGQMNVLSNQIVFSTINVSLVQPAPDKKPEPMVGKKGIGKRVADAWNSSVVFMEDFFTALIVIITALALPLLTIGVVVGAILLIVRWVRRRRTAQMPPPPAGRMIAQQPVPPKPTPPESGSNQG